jgi:hypothetical protein
MIILNMATIKYGNKGANNITYKQGNVHDNKHMETFETMEPSS